MSEGERKLGEDRALRNSARGLFDTRLEQVKADLAARGVGGRIADKAGSEVKAALSEAKAVAADSKGVIAGTVAALGLWLFRKPLAEAARRLFARDQAAVKPEPLEPGEPSTEYRE